MRNTQDTFENRAQSIMMNPHISGLIGVINGQQSPHDYENNEDLS